MRRGRERGRPRRGEVAAVSMPGPGWRWNQSVCADVPSGLPAGGGLAARDGGSEGVQRSLPSRRGKDPARGVADPTRRPGSRDGKHGAGAPEATLLDRRPRLERGPRHRRPGGPGTPGRDRPPGGRLLPTWLAGSASAQASQNLPPRTTLAAVSGHADVCQRQSLPPPRAVPSGPGRRPISSAAATTRP